MKYIRVNIELSREAIEAVTCQLMSIGINDTVVEDPMDVEELMEKRNDYDWDYVDQSVIDQEKNPPMVTVYMEGNKESLEKVEEIRNAMANLKKMGDQGAYGKGVDFGSLKVEHFVLDDSDWKDNWKEFFKPAKISNSIVVKPTWETYVSKGDEVVLEIDPGMAFGTGTHETTSLCVKMMEKYMKKGDKILDVGCGSGILSIAGALLGSQDILGVDIDPVAVEVAQENVQLNRVEDVVKIQYGDLTKGIDYKANIIVANLMADLVIMLSKSVSKHLLPGGIYISSGIIEEKIDTVVEAIKDCGFQIVQVVQDGMWACVVAKL